MKKTLYIIPGLDETTRRRPYQKLRKIAEAKGYEVIFKNVDWKKKISTQIFPVPNDAVVFGFSLGALLAWFVAQQYPCKLIILASMTPHYSFKDSKVRKAFVDLLGAPYIDDIQKNLGLKHKADKQVIMYGDQEEEPGDILVADTQHEITANYLKAIDRLL